MPWLWCRLAAAAPIQPLALELPYVTGVTGRKKKKKKREREDLEPFLLKVFCRLYNRT